MIVDKRVNEEMTTISNHVSRECMLGANYIIILIACISRLSTYVSIIINDIKPASPRKDIIIFHNCMYCMIMRPLRIRCFKQIKVSSVCDRKSCVFVFLQKKEAFNITNEDVDNVYWIGGESNAYYSAKI